MKTADQIGADLSALFDKINEDAIDLKKASELNNTAGKMLKVYQVKLAYAALRDEKPVITGLSSPVDGQQAIQ